MIEQTVEVSNALDLLGNLRPTATRWGDSPKAWLFRGQSDSSNLLTPTAFRDEAWAEFHYAGQPPHQPSREYPEQVDRQAIEEFALLRRFLWAVDGAGLSVPEHMHARHLLNQYPAPGFRANYGVLAQPPTAFGDPALQAVLALAQHHGIPTRLLDFTRSALHAAYFAASGAARRFAAGGDGKLAVWAIPIPFVLMAGSPLPQHAPIDLRIVTTATAPNANLRAQRGLFLMWWNAVASNTVRDLASVVRLLGNHLNDAIGPPLPDGFFKFELPWSESSALCRMLADEGLTAAQMFPSYGGVVRSLREQSTWDRVPYQASSNRDGVFT